MKEQVICALMTPFYNQKVDYKSLGELIERQIASGTDALLALGTTAEPCTLTKKEKHDILRFTIKTARKRVPVIAGVGSPSTSITVKNASEAKKAGADAVLVVTPYYSKCTDSGYIEHIKKVAELKLPVYLYSVPSRTGCKLSPETYAKALATENVKGIKEASDSAACAAKIMKLCDTVLLCGNEKKLGEFIAAGAAGVVSVAASVAPALTRRALVYGEKEAEPYKELVKMCFSKVSPTAVKYLAYAAGLIRSPEVRLPLTVPTGKIKDDIEAFAEKYKEKLL